MKRLKILFVLFLFATQIINAQNKITMKQITIQAQPYPFKTELSKTAVIVVDMQNDFGSRGGMFDHGGIDISMIEKVVQPTSQVLKAARKAGIKIIYLKMAFKPDLSDLGSIESPNRDRHLYLKVGEEMTTPNGLKGRYLIRDTWNTNIIDELKPQAEDIEIYKHRFSGFFETNLDDILKKEGIKNLVITGCTTSICIESTIRDAMFRDYSCILLEDCTAEPIGFGLSRSNHDASLLNVKTLLGWVSKSERFINAL